MEKRKTVKEIINKYATSSIDGNAAIRESKFNDMIDELEGIKPPKKIFILITNLILRIMAFPFVLIIIMIKYIYSGLRHSLLFLIHGGEWINYTKFDRETIQTVYRKVENYFGAED